MGGAWLAAHIWKHYRYTMDQAFSERMMPVLGRVRVVFKDFMIEDQGEMVGVLLFLRRILRLLSEMEQREVPAAQAEPWIPES